MDADPIERLGGLHYLPACRNDRPLGPEDLSRLEARVGWPLPREFADFLLRYPFGPVRFPGRVSFTHPRGGTVELEGFYGLMPDVEDWGGDLDSQVMGRSTCCYQELAFMF